MNKTININLGGYFFHIDEDAYQKLRRYLDAIAKSLSDDPQGKNEIISDIEARISELLSEKITDARQVVNSQDIEDVIKIMGEPEDYADGEEAYTEPGYQGSRRRSTTKKLFRDGDDKFLGGVASGIAHYFDVDVIWIRLAFIVLLLSGFSLILYIILWILLPEAKTTAEKLQMEGEPVNINNIEKKIREEFSNVRDRIKEGAESVSEKISNAEKKYKPKAKSGFQDFLDTLGSILAAFFKVIGKFIGVILIIVAAIVIISLILTAFSVGTLGIPGLDVEYEEFLQLVKASIIPAWLLLTCALILVGFPFLILFILGLRILSSSVRPVSKATSLTLFGIWLTALLIIAFSGIEFSSSHASRGTYIQKDDIQLQPGDSIALKIVNDNSIYYQNYIVRRQLLREVFVEDRPMLYSNYVKVDVRKSEENKSYVQVRKRSRGRNINKAQESASNIQFDYEISDGKILIDGFYLTELGNFAKNEAVYFTLYVQEGVTVYFDDSTSSFLNGVINTDDLYDSDMVNHYFLMTEEGLDCTDCQKEIEEYKEEESVDE
jgi:phage shock protein PspC (stress-responsive transcriptional regulator)